MPSPTLTGLLEACPPNPVNQGIKREISPKLGVGDSARAKFPKDVCQLRANTLSLLDGILVARDGNSSDVIGIIESVSRENYLRDRIRSMRQITVSFLASII